MRVSRTYQAPMYPPLRRRSRSVTACWRHALAHTRHTYTTHATYLYNTRDILIQHTRQTYTTHATNLYNTRDILIQHTRHTCTTHATYKACKSRIPTKYRCICHRAVGAAPPPARWRHALAHKHAHTCTSQLPTVYTNEWGGKVAESCLGS